MSVNFMLNAVANDGFTGDIVIESQKNIENWTASGDGEVSLEFVEGVNTLEFEATGEPSASALYDILMQYYPFSNNKVTMEKNATNLAQLDNILTVWKANPTLHLGVQYITYIRALDHGNLETTGTVFIIYRDGGSTGAGKAWDSGLIPIYLFQSETWSTVDLGGTSYRAQPTTYDCYHEYESYNDFINNHVFALNKQYSITIPTEASKKYLFTFNAKSPTGFNASADNIILENGTSTETITLDNNASNDFKAYKVMFEAESTDVTLTLDLSTIMSSNEIELDVRNIQCYAFG